ncbi:unnamed protein product, partial [Bubo scandiacus]
MGLILAKWEWNNCYLKVRDPDYGHTCTLERASLWHMSWEKLLELKPPPPPRRRPPPAALSLQGRARVGPARLPRPLFRSGPGDRQRRDGSGGGRFPARGGRWAQAPAGPGLGSAPRPAGPCPPASRCRRERPRALARRPMRCAPSRAGNKGVKAPRAGGGGAPRRPEGRGRAGGGRARGPVCRSGWERSLYLHQDGRVVKALDLRSNGRMSAWVRTPLLAKPQRWYLWREMLELTEKLPTTVYLLTSTPDRGHCGSFDPTLSSALCLQFVHHSPCHDPEISCQV